MNPPKSSILSMDLKYNIKFKELQHDLLCHFNSILWSNLIHTFYNSSHPSFCIQLEFLIHFVVLTGAEDREEEESV